MLTCGICRSKVLGSGSWGVALHMGAYRTHAVGVPGQMSVKSISSFGELVYNYLRWQKVKVPQSCPTPCDPMDCSPWNSPGQNTDVGSLFLLQGIFPTQGSNPGLPHCRQILYQLSHKKKARILEWVAYPFSSRSSRPRNRTTVSGHCRRILYQLSYKGRPIYVI